MVLSRSCASSGSWTNAPTTAATTTVRARVRVMDCFTNRLLSEAKSSRGKPMGKRTLDVRLLYPSGGGNPGREVAAHPSRGTPRGKIVTGAVCIRRGQKPTPNYDG